MATRNQVKIISNVKKRSLAFYYMGDVQESWQPVSKENPLSREEYTCAYIRDRAKDIVCEINSIYNQKNRGVDIFFEGSEEDFLLLKKMIADDFPQSGITCVMLQKARIAVSGKNGAGKTTLIKGFWESEAKAFHCLDSEGISSYTDDEETSVWYEIPDIDFVEGSVVNAQNAFKNLAKSGLTTFIYCLRPTKIEQMEKDLIFFVRDNYPAINTLVVLTQFVDEERMHDVEELSANLGGIKVIPALVADMKTRGGVVSAYGLNDIKRYIYEDLIK